MIHKSDLDELCLSCIEDYFVVIVDTIKQKDIETANRLYNKLSKDQKNDCIDYVDSLYDIDINYYLKLTDYSEIVLISI